MTAPLKLISHKLCPYVQRAVIALAEKGVPFERVDIDLSNKPDWFLALSPFGKTPVLMVGVPIAAKLLDRFDLEHRFTVGYHVSAVRKRLRPTS